MPLAFMYATLSSLLHEVLNKVCHAILRPHWGEGLETLTSLARTCEPAVGAIWKTIPDISVIIYTLPQGLWLETHIEITGDENLYRFFRRRLSFQRPPVQSDFAKLKHYAHLIRHVTYPNTCFIPPDILSALAIHFPAGTLLPNIRTLVYRYLASPQSDPNQSLPVLFGPKLRSLNLICSAPCQMDVERAGAKIFDCIRALPCMCPGLSALNVRMDPERKLPLITVVPDIIPSFQDLTHVLVNRIGLDFSAISHLARLQNLNTLNAYLFDEVTTQADVQSLASTSTSRPVYFPSLQEIWLTHRFLSLCTSLLKLVSSPDLDEVMFSTSKESGFNCTSEDVSELCLELSSHPSLTCIIVSVNSPVTGPRFDSTTFKPLLMLPHLSVVDIDIAHPIDIDGELIAYMAFIWRKLTRLSLCVARAPSPLSQLDPVAAFYPAATLLDLVSFALWCPELQWIGLPVNTDLSRVVDVLETRPGRGTALSEMFLDVGLSAAHDPVPVAAFLSDLFPGLQGVRTAWRGVREEDMNADLERYVGRRRNIVARWNEVAELVGDFTTVRKQERNW
ncbi:hypothetical protein LXA43DRAFT_910382, partial [Ganoderma leucocontextum]